jgi:hypothetical protein
MRIRAILALGWLIASTDGRVDSGSRSCGDGVGTLVSSARALALAHPSALSLNTSSHPQLIQHVPPLLRLRHFKAQ